ncbi:hypothetical protein ACFE04_015338 [Oxalis oulophora]
MAEQEFQESDVVFVNDDDDNINNYREMFMFEHHVDDQDYNNQLRKKKIKKNMIMSRSAPMNININNDMLHFMYGEKDEEEDYNNYYDHDGEIVPPHVIVGRRIAGQMAAFSVCTGNGRTLKGRDLSQLRNSVLRMTGFLET